MKLVEIILNKMVKVSKNQKKIIIILVEAIISMYGKVNYRSLERQTGCAEKRFRRWFNKKFNFAEFNEIAMSETIKFGDEIIAAFDPSFIEKNGNGTCGGGVYWDGANSKAKEGLEVSVCSLINVSKSESFTLEAIQTPSMEEIKSNNENDTRIDFYLNFVLKLFPTIKKYAKYFVADGFFAKAKFVNGIVGGGMHSIGKLRIDANLKILYSGEKKIGRGRPKKFNGKCDIDSLEGFSFDCKIDDETMLYSGEFFNEAFDRNLKVVAEIKKTKYGSSKSLLFSTDLDLCAQKIYAYYHARFQIEYIFKDAKQHTGLGDCQARGKNALNFHFNISLLALNIVKIQHHFNKEELEIERPFSMISFKATYHNKNMISRFFPKLGLDLSSEKLSSVYREILDYGTIYSSRI